MSRAAGDQGRPGRRGIRLVARATAGILLAATVLATAPVSGDPLRIDTRAIRHFELARPEVTRFGPLEFLGGLELSSTDRRFGGLSGIVDLGGGRLLAVSDYGFWFACRLVLNVAGRPLELTEVDFEPLTSPDGGRFRSKVAGDAEAVTIDASRGVRRVLVSLESTATILDYPSPPFGQRPRRIQAPPVFATAEDNGRGEAIAVVPSGRYAGSVLTFVEASRDGVTIDGGIRVGGDWKPIAIAVRGGYAVTDAAFLPGGDLLILERRVALFTGIGMRIRRIPAATIAPGATLDGEVLLEAGMGHEIDNMEGLAVGVDGAGRTVLTLVSDDNRSSLQRTLLLRFVLAR